MGVSDLSSYTHGGHPVEFSQEMARTPRDRNQKTRKASKKNGLQLTSEKKDWKSATCSICLEHPHKAVLLLCSSHDKGCRPYMCDTSHKHSNCLEQFKNAYLRGTLACELSGAAAEPSKKLEEMDLACPICRGEVKGWTVVQPARKFLNRKRRSCMHEGCSYFGSYTKLCKHVKSKHPSSTPREIDAARLAEWKELEYEKERQDAISIITSLNPGSTIVGDYFVDPGSDSNDSFDSYGYSSDSLTFSDSSDSESTDFDSHGSDGERPRESTVNVSLGDPGIQRNGSSSSRRPFRVVSPSARVKH
ncbi:uncharacterized protein LOC102711528 isoform X1 [Oryza brachyantha]|uniref:uncharacterized protein LOC102711528 isoform X1 n=1 Tax=Oryza brachyantha TaxID=4533 RepID=UPI0007768DDC|nr:uncharacterized protein LOC102711528 isoform X1 [Oryza brachyantha]